MSMHSFFSMIGAAAAAFVLVLSINMENTGLAATAAAGLIVNSFFFINSIINGE